MTHTDSCFAARGVAAGALPLINSVAVALTIEPIQLCDLVPVAFTVGALTVTFAFTIEIWITLKASALATVSAFAFPRLYSVSQHVQAAGNQCAEAHAASLRGSKPAALMILSTSF